MEIHLITAHFDEMYLKMINGIMMRPSQRLVVFWSQPFNLKYDDERPLAVKAIMLRLGDHLRSTGTAIPRAEAGGECTVCKACIGFGHVPVDCSKVTSHQITDLASHNNHPLTHGIWGLSPASYLGSPFVK